MYSDKVIGNNIRALRLMRNYSQDYLASKLNISQNAYSKLELGYIRIKLETILTITEVLETDIITLITWHSTNPQYEQSIITTN